MPSRQKHKTPELRRRATPLTLFARQLLTEWQRLNLSSAAKIVVGVSGGADSSALLLALDELVKTNHLALTISVAHMDHGLRGKASKEDAEWVESLARRLGHEIEIAHANAKKRARETADNLEQAARRLRYEFFAKAVARANAELLLTAHTMDDQAETVLLNLLRGSGAEGLSGIEAVRPFNLHAKCLLARPLVGWARRADAENYCRQKRVRFRVDEMNVDEKFTRVRVRRQLLPLMQTFNPRIVEALGRTAEVLRADAKFLNLQADELLARASCDLTANAETELPLLSVDMLAEAPVAIRRRALRKWIARGRGDLRRFELIHLIGVEKLLEGRRGGRTAELPGGAAVRRKRGWLELIPKKG